MSEQGMEQAMTEQDVQNWLDEYGRAWVDSDPDLVVTLFADTATYRETPFDNPMRGRDEIRAYWQKYAVETHEDIEFASQVWAVRNDTAIAGWQARYTLKATERGSGSTGRSDSCFQANGALFSAPSSKSGGTGKNPESTAIPLSVHIHSQARAATASKVIGH